MPQVYNDTDIKFEYNGIVTKNSLALNAVGTDGIIDIPTYATQVSGAIYINRSSGNDGNAGTYLSPKASINAGIAACTVSNPIAIIYGGDTYYGEIATVTNLYFQGLFKLAGNNPIICLRNNNFADTNANTIYISKSGSDTTGNGDISNPFLTLDRAELAVTGTRKTAMILDSGDYVEKSSYGVFDSIMSKETCSPSLSFSECAMVSDDIASDPAYNYATGATAHNPIAVQGIENNGILYVVEMYSIYGTSTVQVWMSRIEKSSMTRLARTKIYEVAATDVHDYNTYAAMVALPNGNIFLRFMMHYSTVNHIIDFIINSQGDVVISQLRESISQTGSPRISFHTPIVTDDGQIVTMRLVKATDHWLLEKINPSNLTETTFDAGFNPICSSYWDVYKGADNTCELYTRDNLTPKHYYKSIFDYSTMTAVSYNNALPDDFAIGEIGFVRINSEFYIGQGLYKVGDTLTHIGEPLSYRKLNDTICASDGDIFNIAKTTTGFTLIRHILAFTSLSLADSLIGIKLNDTHTAPITTMICNNVRNCEISKTYPLASMHQVYSGKMGGVTNYIYNSIIIGTGIVINAYVADIKNSIFTQCTKEALIINGQSYNPGDISVNHSDFLNNYSGIKFTGNGGANKVVKNTIVKGNGAYGIDTDSAMTITYCVNMDVNNGVTLSTGCITSNPLYRNEGAQNISYIDLNVKNKELGDRVTSPAVDRSDDNRNTGSYNICVIGSDAVYDSGTIKKPEKIEISKSFTGAVNIKLTDGSADSFKSGQSENVELKWKGITVDEYEVLDDILCCDNNSIRVYFEPITNPTTYYTYTIVRDGWASSSPDIVFDEYGYTNVSLKLTRKYER